MRLRALHELGRTELTGYRHNVQSLRIVEKLEYDGKGLNLTWEVRDGILGHTGSHVPETLEGQIVRIADRIAYVNHDIDDAIRAGVLTQQDLPRGAARGPRAASRSAHHHAWSTTWSSDDCGDRGHRHVARDRGRR